ncbi:hypothetical protein PHPALM_28933 [Phytophthora palmivora]|uniref:Uncharacterized protein n=1 Tax=Phytophthora palmivora TaxID=4796 RepID=A0A2P4X8U9_9STRA|nr:hypothetical protein PHPALM_28933 [Phytophthora palmivora]
MDDDIEVEDDVSLMGEDEENEDDESDLALNPPATKQWVQFESRVQIIRGDIGEIEERRL